MISVGCAITTLIAILQRAQKGIALWPNNENTDYAQISYRMDWNLLYQGEPVYLPGDLLPLKLRMGLSSDNQCYLFGPIYMQGVGKPILPVFINPCIAEWLKEYKGREMDEQKLAKFQKAKQDRIRYRKLLSEVRKQIKFMRKALRAKQAV